MKKTRIILAGTLLLLGSSLVVPVSAAEEEVSFVSVFDECDVLDDIQEEKLNEELADLYNTYEFDAVILTTEAVGEQDAILYAENFMEENQIGYGETGDAMCLLHQPESRDIYVVFQGESKDLFTEKIQNMLLDDGIKVIKDDSKTTYDAYEVMIRELENCLKRVRDGKKIRPMDVRGSGIVGFGFLWLVISAVVMAIPTFILTMLQKGKMKTEKQQENANSYVHVNGLVLDRKEDIYLRTETSREKIQKNEDSDNVTRSSGSDKSSGSGKSY